MAKDKIAVVNVDSDKNVTDESKKPTHIPKLNERLTEELVIAIVGPMGSGCSKTAEIISDILGSDFNYEVHKYKLSEYISKSANLVDQKPEKPTKPEERVHQLQTIGDKLREKCGNSYLAAKAVEEIAKLRDKDGFGTTSSGQAVPKRLRRVHIIDSLKHPEELKLMRSTYGEIFWLVGVFAPFNVRKDRLVHQEEFVEDSISGLAQRDYIEGIKHGQNVRDVFFQADFFIRNDQQNTSRLNKSIERFFEILFDFPVHTPTLDESSMYSAYSESAKSACLSRQVGAAIVSKAGELLGVGRNDVPSKDGGLYGEDHGDDDHRCHAWLGKKCHNDSKKGLLYKQIFESLEKKGLITDTATQNKVTEAIQKTDVKSLIEYSRAVHAEMDAIISVARNQKPGLIGSTLYSTTFPCHSCARHIVASGISKVLFIEPYPKSLATDLHSDSISENESEENDKVVFLQYTGIAPKNILKLFSNGKNRKDKESGRLRNFDKRSASPVVAVSLDDYATHEKWVIAELEENEEKATSESQATLPGFEQ